MNTIKDVKNWIYSLYDNYGIEFYPEYNFSEYKQKQKSKFSFVQIESLNKEKDEAIQICKKNNQNIEDIALQIYQEYSLNLPEDSLSEKIMNFSQFINESKQKFTIQDFENAANDFLNTDIHDEDGWSRYTGSQRQDVQNEPSKTILLYFRECDLISLRYNTTNYNPVEHAFERYNKGFKAYSKEDEECEFLRKDKRK